MDQPTYPTRYGIRWLNRESDIDIELYMLRRGGQWVSKGKTFGNGMLFHFIEFQKLIWPDNKWHEWNLLETELFLKHTYIGEMGCASGGKSFTWAANILADWYMFPDCTTSIVSSTDIKSLKLRIWGIIVALHRAAKDTWDNRPGHLIEGDLVILNDARTYGGEGRDFKNGVIGVPCRRGNQFVGISNFVGIHNKRVRVVFDEANLMPRAVIDCTSNMSKCQDFKLGALGNPNETTNAHGMLCEPAFELGGWEGGIDQTPKTKTWKNRFPNGIVIQLPGADSPNMKVAVNEPPPFPFLMTRRQMEEDAKIWGVEDWHYQMMNNAAMPRGQGSRRIITRQMCLRNEALDEPKWLNGNRIKLAALDAAYGGVGGDRCVLMFLEIGQESEDINAAELNVSNIVNQNPNKQKHRQLLYLANTLIVPVSAKEEMPPEEQIVRYVKEQCELTGVPASNLYYDSGMRSGLVSAFGRIWSPQSNPIDCGGNPSDRMVSAKIQIPCNKYYSKFVTELWYSVRYIIEAKQFRGMSKTVMSEGCEREWMHVGNNRIEAESKADMKKKTGHSPDLFDCLSIGCEGAKRLGFVVDSPVNKEFQRQNDRWKLDLKERSRELWKKGELTYTA